jgi:hypothetical protein
MLISLASSLNSDIYIRERPVCQSITLKAFIAINSDIFKSLQLVLILVKASPLTVAISIKYALLEVDTKSLISRDRKMARAKQRTLDIITKILSFETDRCSALMHE